MSIFSIKSKQEKKEFPWIELTTSDQLKEAIENSTVCPILLFKHSTRCSISSMAKSRFENNWTQKEICNLYCLDLLTFSSISNEIADLTGIEHHSPQVIVIKNKQVIYEETYTSIDAKKIEKILSE